MIRWFVRGLRRLVVLLLAAGGFVLVYRVAAIYRFRPGSCPATGRRAEVFAPGPAGQAGRAGPQEPAAKEARGVAPVLRLVTYNLGGHAALLDGDYLEQAADLLRRLAPDLVALQEVHQGTIQSRFRRQAEELAGLTGLTAVFGESFEGYEGSFGNALLVRGEVLEARVLPLPTFGEPRSLLASRLRFPGSVREIPVFVTHLTTWGPVNRPVRRRQIRCIERHLAAAGESFLLAGDLNATPEAPEIAAFLRSGLVAPAAPQGPTHGLTRRRLDYALPGLAWEVIDERIIHDGPSDHWPVLLVLAPKGG